MSSVHMRRAPSLALMVTLAVGARAQAEPRVEGHTARLLTSGQQSFRARHRNIDNADVVLLKTYAFLGDETGLAMIESLRQRALAGKQVIVQYDVKGSSQGELKLLGQAVGVGRGLPDYLKPLADAGATIIPTNTPTITSPFYGRDHDKLLVTWKAGEPAKLIMGGMNVGNAYAYGGNWGDSPKSTLGYRDADAEISGPETAPAIERFLDAAKDAHAGPATLAALRHATKTITSAPEAFSPMANGDGASVRFHANDPHHGNARSIERLYQRLIAETPAGETVTFANAYTLLQPRMKKAIEAAGARGVKFHFIVSSPNAVETESSALGLAFRSQLRSLFGKMPEGALEVTEFAGDARRNEGTMHQKIAKFGTNGPVVIGSHNLDSISANFNSEAAAVIKSHRVSQQFDALVNRMRREGTVHKVDEASLRADPLHMKAKAFVLNHVGGHVL